MMRLTPYTMTIALGLLVVCSCKSGHSDDSADESAANAIVADADGASKVTDVTVQTLQPKMFTHEVVSNGKVAAGAYVDLQFSATGAVIDHIYVKNGQRVSQGQTIATLDRFKLQNAETNAHTALERAKLDLADAIIGQGYDPEHPDKIPSEVMRLARLRSGVDQSEVALAEAQRALKDATLRAPFSGVVANLFQKSGNLPDGSKAFCRIISTADMEVEFQILEGELSLIHTGDAVAVSPYTTDKTFTGHVSEINPVVDNDGMVEVRAKVAGGSELYDGMNVRVSVKRNIEKALVVPKSAVVLRSGGRPVVFTHVNGRACWNYVTTSLENMTEYVITDGLTPGQEVITSGNLNLAHETPVRIIDN